MPRQWMFSLTWSESQSEKTRKASSIHKKWSRKIKPVEKSEFTNNKKENIVTCMSLDPLWECESLRGKNEKKLSL